MMMKPQNTQPEKTATGAQVTKTAARTLKNISIYLVTVLVAVTFLLHIFLKHPSSSLDGILPIRSENSNAIEQIKDSIVSIADTAPKEQLQDLSEQLRVLRVEEERIDAIYNVKREEARVSGFPSMHKFFWHFGIGMVITALSIFLLISVNNYKGEKKKAAHFASMIAITISGYYMAWIFFPYDDLPYNIYMALLVAIGVLSAITAYWINRIHFYTISQLKFKIRFLLKSIIIDIKPYIKDYKVYSKEFLDPKLDKTNE